MSLLRVMKGFWRVVCRFSVLISFGLSMACAVYAENEPPIDNHYVPTDSEHANWVFSGIVSNEDGERYGYYFQMERDEDKLHATVALFDGQSSQAIMFEDGYATMNDIIVNNWRVGRAFLRFNPINNSWIFGLKPQDKKGFNFKVDMLEPSEPNHHAAQALRPGLQWLITQTGHLNGHVQIGMDSKEQFVTAKNAWFQEAWLTKQPQKHYPLSGALCRFYDGSGFYSINTTAPDAVQGAVVGWRDSAGNASTVSQFVVIKQAPDGLWHIRIPSPNRHLILSNFIKQNSVIAGFITEGKSPGFCMLNRSFM